MDRINCPKCGLKRSPSGRCIPCRNKQSAEYKKKRGTGVREGTPCIKCGGTERYDKSGECANCARERGRTQSVQYRARRTPEKKAQFTVYLQDWYYRKKFGVSLEEVQRFLEEQGGCAICHVEPSGNDPKRFWHLDHDHATDEIRGVLCGSCNRGLGGFKDSSDILRQAADYLDSPPMRKPILRLVK